MPDIENNTARRIGFVSTRISGTDGVSLEIGKWTEVLEAFGHECFFIAGKCDRDPGHSFLINQADFHHAVIEELNSKCFGTKIRLRQVSQLIRETAHSIKDQLYEGIEKFQLDLLIVENALTIPINVPLGAALVEVLLETGIDCILHHHDFVWERERYLVNAVEDYIAAVFPPRFDHLHHVVINSVAGAEFGRRTGQPYRVIPNVMDFETSPPADDYSKDLRKSIGLSEDDIFVLQPTRVVKRKGIEHSIELIKRLDDARYKLVISHSSLDEGHKYADRVRSYAGLLNVDVIFAANRISDCRGISDDGCPCFSIWDAYREADLIAYPSTYEGFGNAFLEAVYYKKPIFCNRYAIYQTDIAPFGFQAIEMSGFVTDEVIKEVRHVLTDHHHRQQIVDTNYEIASRHFSYQQLTTELRTILTELQQFRGP